MAILRSFQKQLIGAGVMGVAAVAAASYASAGSVLVDGYGDFPALPFGVTPSTPTTYAVTDTDILPAGTTVTVSVVSDGLATIFSPSPGVLSLNTPNTATASYMFEYELGETTDFTPYPAFSLNVFDIVDEIDLDYSILLTDAQGDTALYEDIFSTVGINPPPTSGVLSFFLSGFSVIVGDFDLDMVDSFKITIEGVPGNDFSINELVVVPTPAAAGFGLAGLALVASRRRR
ncbi:MAG: hypothetical protein AAFY08_13910 [Planctomycetota bacterium]